MAQSPVARKGLLSNESRGRCPPSDRAEADENPWREPLVRAEVVAEYLQVTVETVFKWARAKKDPLPMRQYGLRGFRRFKMSEIESWLDRRKTTC